MILQGIVPGTTESADQEESPEPPAPVCRELVTPLASPEQRWHRTRASVMSWATTVDTGTVTFLRHDCAEEDDSSGSENRDKVKGLFRFFKQCCH